MTPLVHVLSRTSARLAPLSDTAQLDTQVLLAQILGRSRTWILAHPETELDDRQLGDVERAVQRLEQGEPLPYVLGHWEFYGLEFEITPDTLIPRPETELLVETALAWLRANPEAGLVADVGTGSGCIAVSLAHHLPNLLLIASDISLPTIKVARRNARRHAAGRVQLIQSDLLPPLAQPLDLICANLPYIPTDTLRGLRVYRREPSKALDGGLDGLALIHRLIAQAKENLSPSGALLLEIEAGQGTPAQAFARQAFPNASVQIEQDLAGHDRLLIVRRDG